MTSARSYLTRLRENAQAKRVDALIRHSTELIRQGQEQQSLKLIEGAVRQFPNDPELRLHYAITMLDIRPPEEAALQAVKAIELDTGDAVRVTRAARIVFNWGDIGAARKYAGLAEDLAPANFSFRPELDNLCGLLAAHDGNNALAEEKLRSAVEADPSQEWLTRDLANFLAERGRLKEAMATINEALRHTKDPSRLMKLRDELANDRM